MVAKISPPRPTATSHRALCTHKPAKINDTHIGIPHAEGGGMNKRITCRKGNGLALVGRSVVNAEVAR